MLQTSLCYLIEDGRALMLHRIKKKNDVNYEKWIGVGGKFEPNETPEACMLREFKEETGLTLTQWAYRGVVTFLSQDWSEQMHLFTATGYTGTMQECNEGELAWVPWDEIPTLPIWEGDKVFLELLRTHEAFFQLKLVYDGETLVQAELDGERI